ncbi:hypothetical protein Tco_0500159 [Tanacetum coccineum]
MAFQDARLSKFEADFKQQQGEMTNKIDTFLKAINDLMMGELPSDTVKNQKLNVNSTSPVLFARSYPAQDPQCSSHIHSSINVVTMFSIFLMKDMMQSAASLFFFKENTYMYLEYSSTMTKLRWDILLRQSQFTLLDALANKQALLSSF